MLRSFLTAPRVPLAAAGLAVAFAFAGSSAFAQTAEQVKADFARAVYTHSAPQVHHDQPQPLLRAVVVLRIRLDEQDRWQAEVFRDNPIQPEMTRVALDSVARLPPASGLSAAATALLRGEGLIEAWLFQRDGRFALKTLAKPQRGT